MNRAVLSEMCGFCDTRRFCLNANEARLLEFGENPQFFKISFKI
jgi:hypothetical protein